MTATTAAVMVIAGFGAGLIGYITGLASIVSYPALLAFGLSPVAANVTNTVAMVAVGGGSIASSASELATNRAQMRSLAALAIAGGTAGSALLLLAPGSMFERVVPVLIAIAAIAILLQPLLHERPVVQRLARFYSVGVFLVAVYGGYFGAGAGVMILALTLLATSEPLWRAAMLKSYVLGLANLAAALGFAVFGPVHWPAAIAMAIGGFAGGWCGPPVVARIDAGKLRVVVAICGLGLALWLARVWF
ncbi:sulfite exporter TauE/SafE family protein [Tsukamurella ocularis]|uniref:sulfite exporter TauE/SafE family protein n=1 Tax=Tsukamurella ocularis TaxID=1970234 RepID=UPI00216A5C75|nr:sulfite exporter TauE/SafE family protein [Tsukamurella ocularis]MCS3779480.1 putative membrane protein YfcA [Tsukamurella ocularis]MCS3788047.1 putative membrane protein YfcA [Tsukamurella ocularis]MCS3852363.1 putative membrane protein YfcA [Tsukamurella ocularis]